MGRNRLQPGMTRSMKRKFTIEIDKKVYDILFAEYNDMKKDFENERESYKEEHPEENIDDDIGSFENQLEWVIERYYEDIANLRETSFDHKIERILKQNENIGSKKYMIAKIIRGLD